MRNRYEKAVKGPLGADLTSLGLACFAVGGSLTVVGFFELSVRFCHDFVGKYGETEIRPDEQNCNRTR